MDTRDKAAGMKSAYQLALERLEAQGIAKPREEALSESTKQALADARRLTEAKIAELEILHRDKLAKLVDPAKRAEQEEFYRRERESIERDGETRVDKIRHG